MRTHAGGPSSGPSSDPASGHPSDHHRSGLIRTNPQVGRRGGATAYWSDSLRCTCMHAHHPLEDQTVASSATERDQLMLVDLNEHRVLTTRASLRKHSAHTSTAVPAPCTGSPVKDQHSSAVLSADRWVPGLVPREERREGRPGIRAVLRERGAGGVQRRISAVSKQGGSRLRWAAAQIGARDRSSATAALLTPADLPGEGWRILDERVWRTKGAARTVTAWRSFEQIGRDRWLWTQATPFASSDEAVGRLAAVPERLKRNMRADVRVTATVEPEPPTMPDVEHAWAREEATVGPRGEGIALYVAWVYGNVLSALACSGSRNSWQWIDVSPSPQRRRPASPSPSGTPARKASGPGSSHVTRNPHR